MRNIIIAAVLLVFVVIPLGIMKFNTDTKDGFKELAHITQGMAFASALKSNVTGYYAEYGVMPPDNESIGAPTPDKFADASIKSITVNNGVISVKYSSLSGVDNGVIEFTPSIAHNDYFATWKCTTPSYPDITKYAPQCQYIK